MPELKTGYSAPSATLIAAFCVNQGRLAKRDIEAALFGFDLDQVQLAMAELELGLGMVYRDVTRGNGARTWVERHYHCPLAVRLYAGREVPGAV